MEPTETPEDETTTCRGCDDDYYPIIRDGLCTGCLAEEAYERALGL